MSLFQEAGLGNLTPDEIPESSYAKAEDGVYEGTVTDVYVREGTTNKPDQKWINVEYTFDDGHQELEWFGLPSDPANPSEKELQKLGFYSRRLGDLGVPKNEINTVTADDLIGKRVAVTLRTKGGYQNISRVDLLDDDPRTGAAFDEKFGGNPVEQVPAVSRGVRRPNPFPRQ